jgi:hypothetical protein
MRWLPHSNSSKFHHPALDAAGVLGVGVDH